MIIHPAAQLFPLIDGDAFDRLVTDIESHGQHEPITVMLDGSILDGRNRWRACEQLGIEPITRIYEGADPLGFVISLNLHRRHLNESQRAMVASKIANLPRGTNQHSSIELPTQSQAASMLNVSVAGIKRAAKVRAEGAPELVTAVERGTTSVHAAAKQLHEAKSVPPSLAGESISSAANRQPPALRTSANALDAITRVAKLITVSGPNDELQDAARKARAVLDKRWRGTAPEALAACIRVLLDAIVSGTPGAPPKRL